MMLIATDLRYELKFSFPQTMLDWLLEAIHLHPCGFRKEYPQRQVNSIYFDTYDYQAYQDHLDGFSQRTKLRYRWYGKEPAPQPGNLEVKQKQNNQGSKQIFPVSELVYQSGEKWKDVRQQIRKQVPAELYPLFDTYCQPVLLNRYWRHYFCSAAQNLRITVDTRLQNFEQLAHGNINLTAALPSPELVVMEVKFPVDAYTSAQEVLNCFPARFQRYSKYGESVQAFIAL